MAELSHKCPCCGHPLERIFDYPRVRIHSFERLALPETVDDMSDAAVEKTLAWNRRNPDGQDWSRRGINMTPEIERACQTAEVRQYLDQLAQFEGRDAKPAELLPTFPPDGLFKGAYPVKTTSIFLSVTEGEPTNDGMRTAEVQTLCRGPNLGSAGGPTLMHLGAIARLIYQGILMPMERSV